MIDYSTIPNTSLNFPDTVGLNSTGPGVNDGTPYLKAVIDDLWGANQALLNAAFQLPSGSAEADGASQRLDAMKRILGHPGEIVPWAGDVADPSTGQIRLLPLNGQGVSVASFFELDAACWVGAVDNPTASAFYRADNPSGLPRNAAGAYLILPDARGYAMRGLDVSAVVDPDGASRDIGSIQTDTFQNHTHPVKTEDTYGPTYAIRAGANNVAAGTDLAVVTQSLTELAPAFKAKLPIGWDSASETRMDNLAIRWCIRY